jgi:Protein of unknown function (DUF2630)
VEPKHGSAPLPPLRQVVEDGDLYEALIESYRGHLSELNASLDRCWDLLRQLRALDRLAHDLPPQVVSDPGSQRSS